MTRTIAALTIALLISAGTEAEAQSGMTIETLQLSLEAEDFELIEDSEPGNYTFHAQHFVPEIVAISERGTVDVHLCRGKAGSECWPLPGRGIEAGLKYTYGFFGALNIFLQSPLDTLEESRAFLGMLTEGHHFLRVIIIAPAE